MEISQDLDKEILKDNILNQTSYWSIAMFLSCLNVLALR